MRVLRFLEDIGIEYLILLFGGIGFVCYIFYRGMEMYPNS